VGTVLVVTEAWRRAFPGALVGALVMRRVRNPEQSAALEDRKRRLESELRHSVSASESARSADDSVLRAYADYYRVRGKTYHVKAQRESVAVKGRAIPSRAALVEAMFMAELENLILTAGHDLATITLPVCADFARESESYVLMNGSERAAAAGDMMMVDGVGIISTVLYGPDQRTRIRPETEEVLFAAYAPAGVGEDAVRDHVKAIRANVLLVAPEADTGLLVTVASSRTGVT
jgi:DNA/RNA-binding domain of Phe-tRNA-synthetase-like protein